MSNDVVFALSFVYWLAMTVFGLTLTALQGVIINLTVFTALFSVMCTIHQLLHCKPNRFFVNHIRKPFYSALYIQYIQHRTSETARKLAK